MGAWLGWGGVLSGRRWALGEGGDEWGLAREQGLSRGWVPPGRVSFQALWPHRTFSWDPEEENPRSRETGQRGTGSPCLRVGAGPGSSLCCGFAVPAEAVGRYHQALGFSAHRDPLSEAGGSTATGAVLGSVLFPTLVQQEVRKGLFTSPRQTVVLAGVHRGGVCEAVFLAAGHPWWACEDLTQVLGTWELGESHVM